MGEIAYSIDKILWFTAFIIFVCSLFFRMDTSARIAIAIWLIGNLIMGLIRPFIMDISSSGDTTQIVWYGVWGTVDVLCVWCIYKLHALYHLDASKLARYIMICLLALCALQILRYTDRIILKTEVLADLYRFGVVAINISVVPATLLWLLNGILATTKTTRKKTT